MNRKPFSRDIKENSPELPMRKTKKRLNGAIMNFD